MKHRLDPLRRARLAALRPTVRLATLCSRAANGLTRLTKWAADPEIASALTVESYDRAAHYGQAWHQELDLFDFEGAALDADFPPPPAHLLVVGCGAGRELLALDARGFRCTATDPAPALAEAARARLEGRVAVHVAALETIGSIPALAGPFDGVVVGWGAWGHVLRARDRIAALQALREACPAGPALISWTYEAQPALRGQLASPQAIQRAAQSPGAKDDWRATALVTHDGKFHAKLGRDEIEREAQQAGYGRVDYRSGVTTGFPNAVLLPA